MSDDAKFIKLADRRSNLNEALPVKKDEALARYLKQTFRVLELIPRSVALHLWNQINSTLASANGSRKTEKLKCAAGKKQPRRLEKNVI